MNTDIQHQASVISVEALAGVSPSAILNRFPAFFSGVMEVCDKTLASLTPAHTAASNADGPLAIANKPFVRKLAGRNYSSLADIKVYAPDGFAGSYIDYLEYLTPVVAAAVMIPTNVVAPFNRFVAGLLNSPGRLSSLKPSDVPSVLNEWFKDGDSKLEELFKAQAQSTRLEHIPYRQALTRNADWANIFDRIDDLESAVAKTKPSTFTAQVADLGHNTNRLIDLIKNDPSTYTTSGRMLDELTSTVLVVAKAIEYYATAVYLLRRFEVAINDSVAKVAATIG